MKLASLALRTPLALTKSVLSVALWLCPSCPWEYAAAQQVTTVQVRPDCIAFLNATAPGNSSNIDNRTLGCAFWVVNYSAATGAGVSVSLLGAVDNNNTPGAFSVAPFTPIAPTTNPATSSTDGTIQATGFAAWVRMSWTAGTATTFRGVVYGWKTQPTAVTSGGGGGGGGGPVNITDGQQATGVALTGRPVSVSGTDVGGIVRPLRTNTSGELIITGAAASSNIDNGQQAAGVALTGRPVSVSGTDSGGVVRVARTNTTGQLQVEVVAGSASAVDINNGQQASGAALTGRPATVSGTDSGNLVRPLRTNTSGQLEVAVVSGGGGSGDIDNGQQAAGAVLTGRPVSTSGTDSGGVVRVLRTDASGLLQTNSTVSGTVAVSSVGGTVTTSGTDNIANGQTATGAVIGGRPVTVSGTDSGGVVRELRTNTTGQLEIAGSVTASSNIDNGQQASGAALTGRPVSISGTDSGGLVRPARTNTTGQLEVSVVNTTLASNVQGIQAQGTTAATVNPVLMAGQGSASGNLTNLRVNASGSLLTQDAVDVSSGGFIGATPLVQTMGGRDDSNIGRAVRTDTTGAPLVAGTHAAGDIPVTVNPVVGGGLVSGTGSVQALSLDSSNRLNVADSSILCTLTAPAAGSRIVTLAANTPAAIGTSFAATVSVCSVQLSARNMGDLEIGTTVSAACVGTFTPLLTYFSTTEVARMWGGTQAMQMASTNSTLCLRSSSAGDVAVVLTYR